MNSKFTYVMTMSNAENEVGKVNKILQSCDKSIPFSWKDFFNTSMYFENRDNMVISKMDFDSLQNMFKKNISFEILEKLDAAY